MHATLTLGPLGRRLGVSRSLRSPLSWVSASTSLLHTITEPLKKSQITPLGLKNSIVHLMSWGFKDFRKKLRIARLFRDFLTSDKNSLQRFLSALI